MPAPRFHQALPLKTYYKQAKLGTLLSEEVVQM